MQPNTSEEALRGRIEAAGKSLQTLTPEDALSLVMAFYREERADGCEVDADGDMLLYQWGSDGKDFTWDLTRQFIKEVDFTQEPEDDEEEEPMSQVSLVLHFEPTPDLRGIASGNHWGSSPDEVGDFEAFVRESQAFRAVSGRKPASVELFWGPV